MTTSRPAFSYSLPVTLATETFFLLPFMSCFCRRFIRPDMEDMAISASFTFFTLTTKKAYTRDDKGLRS